MHRYRVAKQAMRDIPIPDKDTEIDPVSTEGDGQKPGRLHCNLRSAPMRNSSGMRLSWKAFSVMADIPVSALVTCLEQVEEPRIDRAQRHAWRDILVLGVRATICGADHLVAIEDFGQANEAWLRTFLALPHGTPSHDTGAGGGRDGMRPGGKPVCWTGSSRPLRSPRGKWWPWTAQAYVGPGTRAGAVSPALGQRLGPGPPFGLGPTGGGGPIQRHCRHPAAVADAGLGRVHRHAGPDIPWVGMPEGERPQIRDQGADCVLAIKETQKHLHARWDDTLGAARSPAFPGCPHDYAETVGKDQGCIETRRCGVIGASDYDPYVDPEPAWADRQSLVLVVSERRRGATVTTATRHFISSCPPRSQALRAAVRGHGRVPSGRENSMLWVLPRRTIMEEMAAGWWPTGLLRLLPHGGAIELGRCMPAAAVTVLIMAVVLWNGPHPVAYPRRHKAVIPAIPAVGRELTLYRESEQAGRCGRARQSGMEDGGQDCGRTTITGVPAPLTKASATLPIIHRDNPERP